MPDKSSLKKAIDLFIIGFLVLYFELLFIRWVPSIIPVASYFPNIILFASFLGLGIGCLLAEVRLSLIHLLTLLVLNMIFLLKKLAAVPVHTQLIKTEYLQGPYSGYGMSFLFILVIVFVINAVIFISLGHKTGNCLRYFKPLGAYALYIAGGIAAVAAFSILSYLPVAPIYWFLAGLVPAFWFYASSVEHLIFQAAIVIVTLYNVLTIGLEPHWSPYYKIDITPAVSPRSHKTLGLSVLANNGHLQHIYNLSDASVASLPELKQEKDVYEFPYNFIHPKNVLILGAGCGNDTAAALRKGTRDIFAVEIDPYIATLGRTEHPERPYESKDVRLYIDDARAFMKKTDEKFDLIVFGHLSAGMVSSPFSSIRPDSFTYTEEAFRDAEELLTNDGIVAVTYLVSKDWMGPKIYATMKEAFGNDLTAFKTSVHRKDDTMIFLAGPGLRNISPAAPPNFTAYKEPAPKEPVITDDRPYPYLKGAGIPLHYLVIMVAIAIISFISVFYIASEPFTKVDGHFFLLGAAFMLLETLTITRSALLFGSTWIVNSAALASILCIMLAANFCAVRITRLNVDIVYVLLAASIGLNWLLRPDMYVGIQRSAGVLMYSFVLSLPLFFGGVIFFNSYRAAQNIPAAFAFNIFGAMIGGLCGYIPMATGFGFLFLLAGGIYYLSYLSRMPEEKQVQDGNTLS